MKKLIFKKQGFTLSEVLTALTIIGVIAALTVPALIQKTQKQEYVSALQKTYSTLSQATNQIIAEHGSPKCDDGGWACSTDGVYNMYKKYLNNAKECGSSSGCFGPKPRKNMNGTSSSSWNTRDDFRRLILADGAEILFADTESLRSCNGVFAGSNGICTRIFVDVNGEKGPNYFGRDNYELVVKEKGLYPCGCDNPDDTHACKIGGNGWGCACKVLTEGAMNY